MRNTALLYSAWYAGTAAVAFILIRPDSLPLAACLFLPMVWLSTIDTVSFIIPDTATIAIAAFGLVFAAARQPEALPFWIGAAAAILVGAWLLGEIYYRGRGRDGLGIGDAKLLAAGALCLGPVEIWKALLLASLGGIAVVLLSPRREAGHNRRAIPFGPLLAYAVFLMLLLGPSQ